MTNTATPIDFGQMLALHVTCPKGSTTEHYIENGASLIVGNGGNCGLKLAGDDVSPIHCVLRYTEGKVAVQDWCSKSGTFVGGTRIADEVSVEPGTEVRVGGYRMETKVADSMPPMLAHITETHEQDVGKYDYSHEAEPDHGTQPLESDTPAGAVTDQDATHVARGYDGKPGLDVRPSVAAPSQQKAADHRLTPDRIEPTPEPTSSAVSPVMPSPAASKPTPPEPEIPAASAAPPAAATGTFRAPARPPRPATRKTIDQSFNQETIELLQEEVELLQSDLAERDARITELTVHTDRDQDHAPPVEDGETEALVARLEDLLDELERSDQRIRTLEELLRTSQESTRADSEEREQVERWLGDIEKRVTEREAEWHAERQVLTKRIEELRGELDETDRQISQAVVATSPDEAHDSTLQNLREENDRLHEQLDEAREQQRRMETRLAEIGDKSAEQVHQDKVEAAIREERLKLSQERATLSRERAEMARQSAEVQQTSSRDRPVAAVDERFNAFRQTLRELHDKEDKPTQRTSLASRISELWRRLDGPTDTD